MSPAVHVQHHLPCHERLSAAGQYEDLWTDGQAMMDGALLQAALDKQGRRCWSQTRMFPWRCMTSMLRPSSCVAL
ncbi:hypothetical protein [Mumia zhuanghuii]|uniref:Uncharacterized protein n=1 Tax=Mumia zhuanghuii TaxID=2585211 RepID=A0A5C4LSX1_9ACTN|nr:hypothetical protein [Mumia zhuanghuii]TNC21769.1 hypothetical protein FHE65_36300 [Mumia zhuanghuii]